MYSGVLALDLPPGVVAIRLPEDIGMPFVARFFEEVELCANAAIYDIKFWWKNARRT